MNSETIKGRLSQHVKRRIQSQESIENKIHLSQNVPTVIPVIPNQPSATIKEEETENSVKLVKKRKMTKKSTTQPEPNLSNPDDDDKGEKRNEKHDTGLDILTLILNHKKSEFLRNPQIIELLSDINKKKGTSLPELIQS